MLFDQLFPFRLLRVAAVTCCVLVVSQKIFAAPADGWTFVTPPLAATPAQGRLDGTNGCLIRLPSPLSIGQWNGFAAVRPGTACRFEAEAEVCPDDALHVPLRNDCMIIVSWTDSTRKRNPVLQRDYLSFSDTVQNGRVIRRFSDTISVPGTASTVKIECLFKWRSGIARFHDVTITTAALPPPRKVRVVVGNPYEKGVDWSKPEESISKRLGQIEATLTNIFTHVEKPDLILFSECFTDTGSPDMSKTAETLPGGPTFRLMSRYAKRQACWIAGNIHEKRLAEGTGRWVYHNTGFLVNRAGALAGVYRKVHLTSSEFQKGVMPGDSFSVFQTDFGRIGFVICWDNWFSESAKTLRMNGAELILFPLAGDAKESHWSKIWSTRAIDTSLPMLVATRQGHLPSAIIDRDGTWLTQTKEENGFCTVDLDLNERKRSFWLSVGPSDGDPYQLYRDERRPSAYFKD